MSEAVPSVQHLLSLPPRMAEAFASLHQRPRPDWFACADPPGRVLGSGGGTTHLLVSAWQATGGKARFAEWLGESQKLLIHAGGQSRRLPAYGPVGKALIPIPVFRWSRGQRLDQTLLDLQLPGYEKLLANAGAGFRLLLASGDVLLRFGHELPAFPNVDVLGLGIAAAPEVAKDFGVFFTARNHEHEIVTFLQKPSVERILELSQEHRAWVDTGLWLLSERAVRLLMARSGWEWEKQGFRSDGPSPYEFYGQFAPALGARPEVADPAIQQMSCGVAALGGEFYHFGTSAQMLESISVLQNLPGDETRIGRLGGRGQRAQVNQNSILKAPLERTGEQVFWIENSVVPSSWQLKTDHVLTGIPENDWPMRLEPSVCLDFVPVGETGFHLRAYGCRDSFCGPLKESKTVWFGRPALEWFKARRLDPEQCGLNLSADLQDAPLFPAWVPVGSAAGKSSDDASFIQWIFAANPPTDSNLAKRWKESPRLSANELFQRANVARLYEQRDRLRTECLLPMLRNFRSSVFFQLDLDATARSFAAHELELPEIPVKLQDDPLMTVHAGMFRAAVLRHRARPEGEWRGAELDTFGLLRNAIIREAELTAVSPRCNVLEDQIVWARSPARLDLAGGWTDTPPYCLEHGGRVVNLAVDLNGQPPIQVFARICRKPELVMRSIDLGLEQRVRSYKELEVFSHSDTEFGLAKAGFALAGFLPRFFAGTPCASLEEQLRAFGGGIEMSLLSAIPKGSGMGASSILAATILAALGELCGLNWDQEALFARTLVLEQMLTTGGGWQDQAGALFHGVKLIETLPGMKQRPSVNWLPDRLFGPDYANRSALLYYTGLTRLAKNILGEIVRGIFLNASRHLEIISDIGANAQRAATAIQRCDQAMLAQVVKASWGLNQRLDAGTNPPAVQEILSRISDLAVSAKLLGAGGGGYLFILAKDESAGFRIRKLLGDEPPNALARFVDFSLSRTGLQVTKS